MYKIIRAQLRAATTFADACAMLREAQHVSKEVTAVAREGVNAAERGDLVATGWEQSCRIPQIHVGMLKVAERRGTVADALDDLLLMHDTTPSFAKDVVLPNLYHLVVLAIALTGVYFSSALFEMIALPGTDPNTVPVYKMSKWMQQWMPTVALVSVGLLLFVIWGRPNLTGTSRLSLLIFDLEWRWQFGLRYSRLCEGLYRQGGNEAEMLEATSTSLGHGAFAKRYLKEVSEALSTRGQALHVALSDRLLTKDMATVLGGLTPGGSRSLLPAAFNALADMHEAFLQKIYRKWRTTSRFVLLVSIAILILLFLSSLFDFALAASQAF